MSAEVGIVGSADERGLEAARLALSEPNLSGVNAGFLREDALLVLVFLSDEEDDSPSFEAIAPPSQYVSYFLALKGNRPEKVAVKAIIGDVPSGCSTGPDGEGGADAGSRYAVLAAGLGGSWSSICSSNFAPALADIGVTLDAMRKSYHLSRVPDPATLVVTVDGAPPAPGAWSWSAADGAVVFTDATLPSSGAQVRIEYDAACE